MFFGDGRAADWDRNSRSPSVTQFTVALSRSSVSTVILMWRIPITRVSHRWKSACTAITISSRTIPGSRRSMSITTPRIQRPGEKSTMSPSTSYSIINGTSTAKSLARNVTGRFRTINACRIRNGAWGCAWNVIMNEMPTSIAGWRAIANWKLLVIR